MANSTDPQPSDGADREPELETPEELQEAFEPEREYLLSTDGYGYLADGFLEWCESLGISSLEADDISSAVELYEGAHPPEKADGWVRMLNPGICDDDAEVFAKAISSEEDESVACDKANEEFVAWLEVWLESRNVMYVIRNAERTLGSLHELGRNGSHAQVDKGDVADSLEEFERLFTTK
jgi:hypothetical protein